MVVRYFSAIHLALINKLKCKNYNDKINIKKESEEFKWRMKIII